VGNFSNSQTKEQSITGGLHCYKLTLLRRIASPHSALLKKEDPILILKAKADPILDSLKATA
jgi:hypothetical protein